MRKGDIVAQRYELGELLGVGGMGEVWSARNVVTEREFAVKFLHRQFAQAEDVRKRFVREARASSQIDHPSIVDVFDVGSEGDVLFMVMEMLRGVSFAKALESEPPMPMREFLGVMTDVCSALEAAHRAGIVHRDIKPSNIFITADRRTGQSIGKVLDFGISKFTTGSDGSLTESRDQLGSPRYMSPEQISDPRNIDYRADVWSVGVILYWGLSGRWPFEGETSAQLLLNVATKEPRCIDDVAPHLDGELRETVRSCLQRVARRAVTAGDLAARLGAIAARIPPTVRLLSRDPVTVVRVPPPSATSAVTAETEPARPSFPASERMVPFTEVASPDALRRVSDQTPLGQTSLSTTTTASFTGARSSARLGGQRPWIVVGAASAFVALMFGAVVWSRDAGDSIPAALAGAGLSARASAMATAAAADRLPTPADRGEVTPVEPDARAPSPKAPSLPASEPKSQPPRGRAKTSNKAGDPASRLPDMGSGLP
jgi:serine/threonine-protein kinase